MDPTNDTLSHLELLDLIIHKNPINWNMGVGVGNFTYVKMKYNSSNADFLFTQKLFYF